MTKVFLNGKILPERRAVVSIHDHGFLYGDGVYETIRVYGGEPFLLKAHLQRLSRSLRGIALTLPMTPAALQAAIRRTVRANGLSEAVVRLTVTRGPGSRGLDPTLCHAPTVLITVVPAVPPAAALYERGVTAAVVPVRRNHPLAVPPDVKSISCLNGVLAKIAANRVGAFEGIFLTDDGFVAEGTVTNVFAVKNGVVLTPALDGTFLPGVTRALVISLARRKGWRVREVRLTPAALASADEVFLTSTVMEVLPVSRLILAGGGRRKTVRFAVGPVSAALRRQPGFPRRNATLV